MDREQANSLSDQAMELIERIGALRVPRNFQLFFEYAEGTNQNLVEAVDALLSNDAKPSPSELDLLFDNHLSDSTECDKLGEMGERLGREIRDAMDVVHEAATSTDSFSDSVSSAEAELGDFTDPERIRVAVASLVQVTRQMTEHSAELKSKLSSSVEQIEELKDALEHVRLESQKDALTGVANRKCFEQTLHNEIERAQVSGDPLSLCMVDLDHFKQFNDSYGHRAGDAALRVVASIFDHNVRDYDLVARYGGEEFALIMPNAQRETAIKVSTRICKALSSKQIVKRSTGERLGNISVSVGVAQLRGDDTSDSFIERADAALYEAKRAGRNRVLPEREEAFTPVSGCVA